MLGHVPNCCVHPQVVRTRRVGRDGVRSTHLNDRKGLEPQE